MKNLTILIFASLILNPVSAGEKYQAPKFAPTKAQLKSPQWKNSASADPSQKRYVIKKANSKVRDVASKKQDGNPSQKGIQMWKYQENSLKKK